MGFGTGWMDLSRTKWESAQECDIKCNMLNGGAHGHRLWCVGEGGEGGAKTTMMMAATTMGAEGRVVRPRDPPHCASVPLTPTRVGIRNNPKPMGLQLADIRRPACECRSVPMAGSHENCRKRKKEGELCGCEWIICPVNITELHMRGSVFRTAQ
jgi:hypothetical protein